MAEPVPKPDGEYVLYEDVKRLVACYDDTVARLEDDVIAAYKERDEAVAQRDDMEKERDQYSEAVHLVYDLVKPLA